MRAVIRNTYGSPDVLEFQEIDMPDLTDDGVLVRVRAASINPVDRYTLTGTPYVARLQSGLRKPKSNRLGTDFAGTVEAVGKDVTQFRPGDEVFGARSGALAEYVCVRDAVVLKPANLTFEQAAAVPVAALTALQGLRDKGQIQPGQSVVINGASGGVGTFAVQIAKVLGAEVTGVCSTKNVDRVRSLGADHVIDYTKEDFTLGDRRYDMVRNETRTQTARERRHRRSSKRQRSDRAAGPYRQDTPSVAAKPTEGRVFRRQIKQGGPDGRGRVSRVRESDTGCRQALRDERDSRRFPVSRRRTCSRKNRRHLVNSVRTRGITT